MMKLNLTILAMTLLAVSMQVMAFGPIYPNSTSVSTTVIPLPATFILYNTTTKVINAGVGGTLFIKSPKGFNMSMVIAPGTYANLSGTILSNYNVTLSTFRTYNLAAPLNAPNDTPKSAFLFMINGQIIRTVAFVNATGGPKPITFTVNHGSNWTSYSYAVGITNGTGYLGGNYGKQNTWIYNTTAGTMSDVSFDKAQMHVYELIPAPTTAPTTMTTIPASVTTVAATTAVTTTQSGSTSTPSGYSSLGGSTLWIIIIVVIIIIIIAAAMMRKKR